MRKVLFKMAFLRFGWGIAVMIILMSKGGDSQPACAVPPINSRILGGQEASPGSWPWHVAFVSRGGYIQCQGSLITDEWVLTAAQCYNSYLSGAVVHLGLGANNQSGLGEVTRRVDCVLCHQDFNYYNTYEHDICLVKLSAPVNFTDNIRPVCLAAEDSTFYDGTSSWVTGFKNDYYSSYYYASNTLQEVDVSVIGENECTCFYNTSSYYYYYYYNRPITENMMCAGSENVSKEAYYGDQGAALVSKKDSIWVQSGIVSYVYAHWLGRPTVYTRVSRYQKWISAKVTGMQPGFITFNSPGNNSDLNFVCPTPAPTTPSPFYTYFSNFTINYPHYTTDDSIFASGGENLIPISRVLPLSALVLLLHFFVGSAGI